MEKYLTQRQWQILRLSADGLSCKQIARQLDISLYTVQKHRSNILSKLNLRNAVQMQIYLENREDSPHSKVKPQF